MYLIQDFALTGVGPGMVEPVIKLLYPTFLITPENNFAHIHNLYLQIAIEMGFPGLIAHLSLYLILLYLLLQRVRDRSAVFSQALA